MESDWSIEIGSGLARITIPWVNESSTPGDRCKFIDLSSTFDLSTSIASIPEAQAEPALFNALLELNDRGSPVYTSKCDLWVLEFGDVDPYEFDASGSAEAGRASYIDFVFREAALFSSLNGHENWMRRATTHLRMQSLRSVRVDFVLRQAEVKGIEGFGITLYAMGCGHDNASAAASWREALRTAVDTISGSQSDFAAPNP